MPDYFKTVMPDYFKTVMPDLIGHPGFACMDTRLRGYDRKVFMSDFFKTVMPDLIGHPCLLDASSSGQAQG